MSGLPEGQYAHYLIIAIVASVFAALLEPLFKRSMKPWKRFGWLIFLILIAIGGYWTVRWFAKSKATTTSSTTNSLESSKDNPISAFIRENIVPPQKGLRMNGQWAVVISEPIGEKVYPNLISAASGALAQKGLSISAIFRPTATRGSGFDTLFAADPSLTTRLHEYCDHVFLGKIVSTTNEIPISPGLLSLTMTLEGKIIATDTGNIQHQFEISAVGAGYSPQEAKDNAQQIIAVNLRSELLNAIK
jgi:hypothetical protein